jgi:hypothetical protein
MRGSQRGPNRRIHIVDGKTFDTTFGGKRERQRGERTRADAKPQPHDRATKGVKSSASKSANVPSVLDANEFAEPA